MTKPLRHTKPLLAALLGAAALLLTAPAAQASPAALQSATNQCWLDVVNDWVQHQPNVVGTYPIPCYTQAIQHLNAYSDIAGYSSAPDDIHRALLAAIHQERGNGGPGGGGGGSNSSGNQAGGGGGGGGSGGGGGGGILGGIFGPHDAQSIPLPLIVLGALAVLLALAALATWVARRYQGRRPQPAPAVSRRR